MNTGEIYRLLERYYEGLTTETEENELRSFFRNGDVPPEMEDERLIFILMERSPGETPMPDMGFEDRIINAVDLDERRRIRGRRTLYAILSSAAAVLMFFGIWFGFVHDTRKTDTFNDPRLAYNEAARILYNVSERMNNGLSAIEPARKASQTASREIRRVEKSTGMISDNLKPLNYFRKAMVIVSSPLETKSRLK